MSDVPVIKEPSWARQLELLYRVRGIGPYEDWLARPAPHQGFPSIVTARFPHPERPDRDALTARLIEATGTARAVAHHQVVECLGMVGDAEDGAAQVLEALDGIDLEGLLKNRPEGAPTPVGISLYIGRKIFDALTHAHSLDMVHGALTPDQIFITRDGQVKVDFGLATGRRPAEQLAHTQPVDVRYINPQWVMQDRGQSVRTDLYAAAAIVWMLLTGRPYRTGITDEPGPHLSTLMDGLPPKLDDILRGALEDQPSQNARALSSALTRVFYVDLDADDQQDGQAPIAHWVQNVAQEPYNEPSLAVDIDVDSQGLDPPPGPFTRVLMERHGPVRPKEFDRDDVDLGSLSNPARGDSMSTNPDRPALMGPESREVQNPTPYPDPMQPFPEVSQPFAPAVVPRNPTPYPDPMQPVPHPRGATPYPDPRYPSARFPSQLRPIDVPPTPSGPMHAVQPMPYPQSGPMTPPMGSMTPPMGTETRMIILRYNRMTWFLTGFAITFSLIVLYDYLFR